MTVTSSNYATILAAIKTIMEGVSSVGLVHDYGRNLKSLEDFTAQFQSGDLIKGWWIQRRASGEVRVHGTVGNNSRNHVFIVRGIMSYDDATESEKTFQNLIESVCDTFRGNYTLNSTCFQASPMQVDVVDERMFGAGGGSILCHYTELRLDVQETLLNG